MRRLVEDELHQLKLFNHSQSKHKGRCRSRAKPNLKHTPLHNVSGTENSWNNFGLSRLRIAHI